MTDGASTEAATVWEGVVGQQKAVARLRAAAPEPVHAYRVGGPAGSTKETAARAFAAAVISGSDDADSRDARLALAGEHPDVREYHRVGPAISAEQAREIATHSTMSPTEGDSKVLILHEFHLLRPEGAALLLKSIEEPPPATIFVICADSVPSDLVTVASRCARIDFTSIPADMIASTLRADGVADEHADAAAKSANGNLDRARLLAGDTRLEARRQAFATVPHDLDGSGSAAMAQVDALLGMIEDAAAPLAERHATEVAELNERIERTGERGSGRKQLEERHKRELRRHRTDELLSGLTTLAATYRDALVDHPDTLDDPGPVIDAVKRIHQTMESMEYNPNETLMLASLLWSLPSVRRPEVTPGALHSVAAPE